MLWDDVDSWEDGLRSLSYLKCFLLRSWRSIREDEGTEDMLVRQWLINSPPKLHNVLVWTGAHQNHGCMVGLELDQYGRWGWRKSYKRVIMNAETNDVLFI